MTPTEREQKAKDWLHRRNLPEGLKYELVTLLADTERATLERVADIAEDNAQQCHFASTGSTGSVKARMVARREALRKLASELRQQAKEIPS